MIDERIKTELLTLCKFHPGFGGKFKYFITLNILCLNEKSKYASGPETCTCPLAFIKKKTQHMKKLTLIILLISGFNVFAQEIKLIDFKNEINGYDLSCLFIPKQIPESYKEFTIKPGGPIGFFGGNYQRIHIKFITVNQKDKVSGAYIVAGKSMLKENICPFSGEMKIIEAKLFQESDISEFKQGYVVFEYEFQEDISQGGTGIFKGKATSYFFIDDKDNIYYDAIQLAADGYSNNEFEGVWISNKSGKKYKCNWGEFHLDRGWRTYEYAKGYGYASEASEEDIKNAKMIEKKEWWK